MDNPALLGHAVTTHTINLQSLQVDQIVKGVGIDRVDLVVLKIPRERGEQSHGLNTVVRVRLLDLVSGTRI